jgi:hypothetical protein
MTLTLYQLYLQLVTKEVLVILIRQSIHIYNTYSIEKIRYMHLELTSTCEGQQIHLTKYLKIKSEDTKECKQISQQDC